MTLAILILRSFLPALALIPVGAIIYLGVLFGVGGISKDDIQRFLSSIARKSA